MSVKIKNTVIIITLIAVAMPFILVTDIFPFLRFGMFAESVKTPGQNEQFMISYKDHSGKIHLFNSSSIGIEPHFFNYLSRNYFYRKESSIFLKKLDDIVKNDSISEWQFKRFIKDSEADTIVIYKQR